MMFRKLRADEIDARVKEINEKRLTLLLYKDARVDMNMLDEVVGPMNWQREHFMIEGRLYCRVSIWDEKKALWVSKSDVGTESNTEKEKGQASDSFKRACVNWGIGRELYSSPEIVIYAGNYTAKEYTDRTGQKKWRTFDRFEVTSIGYDDTGSITQLSIINTKTKKSVFEYGEKAEELPDWNKKIDQHTWDVLKDICKKANVDVEDLLNRYGYSIEKPSEISVRDYYDMIKRIEEGKA